MQALLHAAEVFRTVGHAAEHGVRQPTGGDARARPAGGETRARRGIVTTLHKGHKGLALHD